MEPLLPHQDRPEQAMRLAPKLRAMAAQGVYFGTSSWKYEGWLGSVYSTERYVTRGKHSKAKFEADCLAEYAETFPTVCGDFAFYQFPTPDYWARLFGGTLPGFVIGLKVPEDVTVANWPGHARFGACAGRDNEHFLDPALFTLLFRKRLEPHADRVGPLISEFGTFNKSTFATPDQFVERLDDFLGALPSGFRYAVEIRNPEYLGPGYFACLSSRGVAHVFNAWTRMPELGKQIEMPGAFTADFTVVRALLSKGRTYEQAVETFKPYKLTQEPNQAGRDAMVAIAKRTMPSKQQAYFFVNNRYEGNAPSTIEAVADAIG